MTALALTRGVGGTQAWAQTTPPARKNTPAASPVNSQVQVSQRFLRALLRGDYVVAYGQLAPEVQLGISAARFRQLAQSIVRQGQRHGTAIELYKMGLRLDEAGQGGEPFVAFSWAADAASEQRTPPQWLEVMFRDADARQVLGFRLRQR